MERHFSRKTFGIQDVLCACARRGYRVNDCTLHWNFLVTPVFFTEFCLLLFFVTFVCLSFHEYFLKLLNRQNNIHGKGIQVSHLISRHQCSMIHVYMPHDSPYVNLQLGFVSTILKCRYFIVKPKQSAGIPAHQGTHFLKYGIIINPCSSSVAPHITRISCNIE